MLRKLFNGAIILAMLLAFPSAAFAQDGTVPVVPSVDVSEWLIPEGDIVEVQPYVAAELAQATGMVDVVVQLADDPVAVAAGKTSSSGKTMSAAGQSSYKTSLGARQTSVMGQIAGLGGVEQARVSVALNAVIVSIPAENILAVSRLPGVKSVRPVGNYEKDLAETVPYIGAAAVQAAGYDGTGVVVAVLDSGIDYMHYNLGGSGDVAEYDANDPTIIEPGTFPTVKVIGGYDFVGEDWPTYGDRTEDPDPIDMGPGSGHGTHVADIIGGRSNDGLHVGVAPGVSFYAVKVCSSVSTSCNGVALLLGMDFALDPNGDGNISDHVDVVNMSLGSGYGQKEDDLSLASANAVKAGVVVVTSAGNSANRPYIAGSPSTTPEVISVAQTEVPSAVAYPLVITSPANIAGVYPNTATVDWAPIGAGITGEVVYVGRACPGDTLLADPTGKVALVDRGTCSISLKVDVAAKAGATGVLLGLIASGDAVSFSFGGGDMMVPMLVIIKPYADMIKANIAAPVVVDIRAENGLPMVGSIVGSSSRGPSYSYQQIKPDIGAPGGSLSAEVGTGNGQTAFSGTSGAAPMVSGAAALVLDARPKLTPLEVKALLVQTAETNIQTNPAMAPGVLAPITRIGGGEVRVDRAVAAMTIAGDWDAKLTNLSYGYHPVIGTKLFSKKLVVYNYSNKPRTYKIDPQFRYADDAASGAVQIIAPKTVTVPAKGYKIVMISLKVYASKLNEWALYGGSTGGNGPDLEVNEYDGYINISDKLESIHVPWHILPHKSANVVVTPLKLTLSGKTKPVKLTNALGATDGWVEVFSWTGSSPKIPSSELPGPGDNFAVIDLRSVGVRAVQTGATSYGVQFAISTYGIRSHPAYPAEFDVYIDTNRDGTDDFVVYNAENGTFASTGQVVVNVVNLATGAGGAYYYIDAQMDSGNVILTAPLAAMGMDLTTQFDFSVYAFDNYFTGSLTDSIEGMTHTLGTPKFTADFDEVVVAPNKSESIMVSAVPGGDVASPSDKGLLFMFYDAYLKGSKSLESFELPIKP